MSLEKITRVQCDRCPTTTLLVPARFKNTREATRAREAAGWTRGAGSGNSVTRQDFCPACTQERIDAVAAALQEEYP